MKKCKVCLIEKNINDFHKKQSKCKECTKVFYQENKDKILNQTRRYYDLNREIAREKRRNYYHKNSEILKPKMLEWKKSNSDLLKETSKQWYENNKERISQNRRENYKENWQLMRNYFNEYHKNRKLSDPIYNLRFNISSLIRESFKNRGFRKENTKTVEILGCSVEYFHEYIQSMFEPWMNWENKGKYNGGFNEGWDIDHIVPMCSAKNVEDVIKLNHYTNLQPLCCKINREIKSGKIIFKNESYIVF